MNPFTENGGGIEVIELIAGSEKTLFQSLRSLFHIDEKGNIISLNGTADDSFVDNVVGTNISSGGLTRSLLLPISEKQMINFKGGYGELWKKHQHMDSFKIVEQKT